MLKKALQIISSTPRKIGGDPVERISILTRTAVDATTSAAVIAYQADRFLIVSNNKGSLIVVPVAQRSQVVTA